MLVGVYGDIHLTKNMRSFQSTWDLSAMQSINEMYDKFDKLKVECAVCLGDFFDAPRIEARSMNLVMPILDTINSRAYPTYFLLGNHEADSTESNILEILSSYENIIPITRTMSVKGMLFIPYFDDPRLYDMKDASVVFTHHGIYGSELASGKTTAFFGLPPATFEDAKLVMNGHVHLKSRVTENILNAGSLLVSQLGELKVGDYPSYYLLDTDSSKIVDNFYNTHSMIYLSIDESEGEKVKFYDYEKLILRVEYEKELPDIFINAAHIRWKKKLISIDSVEESISTASNFDMKNYLVEYISKDPELSEEVKENYTKIGLELLV